ncbi:MAG TPA: methyltransferase domain-containing protein [Vicinamibacterales bacterium]
MMDLTRRRRFFAEEIEAVCRLRSPLLVDALADVPRERFLRPGPWTIVADGELGFSTIKTRTTADADPARIYHNVAVAIDPDRQLFNGQPGTLAAWIDTLDIGPGARILHVGCGLGYYTAVLARCAGPSGRVLALEADAALAADARANLASMPWVEVRHDQASGPLDATFDAILVNAGVTHPLDSWLDALSPGGGMILPLTSTMIPMGNVGKGLVFHVTRNKEDQEACAARALAVVAIYSAVGVRDEDLNERLGKAMMAGPAMWMAVSRLRRDAHDASASCWLHGDGWCLSAL